MLHSLHQKPQMANKKPFIEGNKCTISGIIFWHVAYDLLRKFDQITIMVILEYFVCSQEVNLS